MEDNVCLVCSKTIIGIGVNVKNCWWRVGDNGQMEQANEDGLVCLRCLRKELAEA